MTTSSQDEIQNIEPLEFDLGAIVVTRGVDAFLDGNHLPLVIPLNQHKKGDWGLCCEEDAISNNFATHNGDRVLSVYEINDERIWIITEWDRSVTTILFPSEY
ncbi:TPA: type I restriction endonuclease subunit M [Photobacterium damselae]